MRFLPTTEASILRGETIDSFGDPQDISTVVENGIPASIIDPVATVRTRGDTDPRVVRNTTIRLPAGTDVREDDRVLDERTGRIYAIDAVTAQGGYAFPNDVKITARDPVAYWTPALIPLRTALEARNANIVVIGDSNGEGQGATLVDNRWVTKLQAQLRTRYGISGGVGFLPTWYLAAITPAPMTQFASGGGGVFIVDTRYGFGGRSMLYSKANELRITQPMTSFTLHYAKDPLGVNTNVFVDNVSVGSVSNNGTAGGGFGQTFSGFSAGTHTIRLVNSDPVVGFGSLVEGVTIRSGDEGQRIDVVDASHSAWSTTDVTDEHMKPLAVSPPDAIIFAHGTNDAALRTPAQYLTQLRALRDRAHARVPSGRRYSRIFLGMPERADTVWNLAPWGEYIKIMRQVAAETPYGYFLNLSDSIPHGSTPSGMYSDLVHLSITGHAAAARDVEGEIT